MKGRDEFHFAEPMKGALLYTFRRMVRCTDLHRTKATSYAGRRGRQFPPYTQGSLSEIDTDYKKQTYDRNYKFCLTVLRTPGLNCPFFFKNR